MRRCAAHPQEARRHYLICWQRSNVTTANTSLSTFLRLHNMHAYFFLTFLQILIFRRAELLISFVYTVHSITIKITILIKFISGAWGKERRINENPFYGMQVFIDLFKNNKKTLKICLVVSLDHISSFLSNGNRWDVGVTGNNCRHNTSINNP